MIQVIHAAFRRVAERDGRTCGEVEVNTDQAEAPKVLAYFAAAKNNDYDLVAVVKNDADYEIDWYDNSMHQAFTDETAIFKADGAEESGEERSSFKEQVLSHGNIREELRRELIG
ncbi:hypothetical protein DNH61_19215 [Paenibacillus sambharensis]|uniref:Uncharacterized protein n=1 Tax=Paenibacillus sambharensis TaxID=1803190 RepID=A0A2W1L7G4_9BACL|nr:hypothetical protein [Paenibacillus sambharensis]PZD94090.1 hypothetical protein DNH61_19215 [Paenibacillus sambharensis]